MGVPQNHPFIDAYYRCLFHYKPSNCGYLHLWKPPIFIIFASTIHDQSHAAQAVNLWEFYESSAWVAKQLAVPLRPSSFGRRYADALHEAGVTRRCGKDSM